MTTYHRNGMIVDGNGVARQRCPTCGEQFQPRNFIRHRKACLKRMRKAQKSNAVNKTSQF